MVGLTLGLPELRSHRHRRALLNLLAALPGGFGGFQSWITTNEDGGNRADGASNEGQEEGVIHARRYGLLSNAGMKSGYLAMLTGLRNAGSGRLLEGGLRLLGEQSG